MPEVLLLVVLILQDVDQILGISLLPLQTAQHVYFRAEIVMQLGLKQWGHHHLYDHDHLSLFLFLGNLSRRAQACGRCSNPPGILFLLLLWILLCFTCILRILWNLL